VPPTPYTHGIPTDVSNTNTNTNTNNNNTNNNIKNAIINLIDYISSKPHSNDEEKRELLGQSIDEIQKEVDEIRESHGGRRRTYKRSHRNKRRHTRARK
jgi:hypothetical protein